MAIKPKYSQAILSGKKTVEFRKRRLAQDIQVVLIYESSPTKRVVGRFTIEDSFAASPGSLWENFSDCGGITKIDFDNYYVGSEQGIALRITDVESFDTPVALDELPGRPVAPQSVRYLGSDALAIPRQSCPRSPERVQATFPRPSAGADHAS